MLGDIVVEYIAQIILRVFYELIVGLYKLIKKGIYKLFRIEVKLTEKQKIEKNICIKN